MGIQDIFNEAVMDALDQVKLYVFHHPDEVCHYMVMSSSPELAINEISLASGYTTDYIKENIKTYGKMGEFIIFNF